ALAKQPATLAERGADLAAELAQIAVGKSDRAPARTDRRFSDPAWEGNPVLRAIMQAYLAASDAATHLFEDAHLDYDDAEKVKFALDNVVEGLAPTNNPLINPLAYKAFIDTGGMSAVRGARAFVRDMAAKPRIPAMVESDAYVVGETLAVSSGSVVLGTEMFVRIQYAR